MFVEFSDQGHGSETRHRLHMVLDHVLLVLILILFALALMPGTAAAEVVAGDDDMKGDD